MPGNRDNSAAENTVAEEGTIEKSSANTELANVISAALTAECTTQITVFFFFSRVKIIICFYFFQESDEAKDCYDQITA